MAPQHSLYIFERFSRVERSQARNEGGSDIGLAIVNQMAYVIDKRVNITLQLLPLH
jgi:signal transduction histidine kinase